MPRHFITLYREIERKKIFFFFFYFLYIYNFFTGGAGHRGTPGDMYNFSFLNMYLLVNIAKFFRKNAAPRRISSPAGCRLLRQDGAPPISTTLKKGALSRPSFFLIFVILAKRNIVLLRQSKLHHSLPNLSSFSVCSFHYHLFCISVLICI